MTETQPATRLTRNDAGVSVINLIVYIVMAAILLGVIGNSLFVWIGRAEQSVLESNLQTLASTTELVLLTDKPTSAADLEGHLVVEGATYTIEDGTDWDNPTATNVGKSVVHIQMLSQEDGMGASVETLPSDTVVAATTTAPGVPWLFRAGGAFRLAIVDESGAWACALVVSATRAYDETGNTAADDIDREVAAAIKGIWYDKSDDETFSASACSPVAAANDSPIPPTDPTQWEITTGVRVLYRSLEAVA